MKEEIRKFLEKADHALIVAEDLMARGHAPDAASKTYYACSMPLKRCSNQKRLKS